jgi:hypothetical protein
VTDPRAVCFCIVGAIERTHGDADFQAWEALRDAANGGTGSVAEWNDAPERTHAEVMDAFDAAIRAEEAR